MAGMDMNDLQWKKNLTVCYLDELVFRHNFCVSPAEVRLVAKSSGQPSW